MLGAEAVAVDTTLEAIKIAAQGGAAVVAIIVTFRFLAHLKDEREANAHERALDRESFQSSIQHVADAHERVMASVASNLHEVRESTVRLEARIEHIAAQRKAV